MSVDSQGALIIPDNIESLSMWELVQIFHQHGDVLIPLHPVNSRRVNTPLKKTNKRLDDHELSLHFGNGANLNIGVIPKEGEIIVDLDGREMEDVRRFLDTRPSLAKVPQVRTAKGCHLRFRCEDLPLEIKEAGFGKTGPVHKNSADVRRIKS